MTSVLEIEVEVFLDENLLLDDVGQPFTRQEKEAVVVEIAVVALDGETVVAGGVGVVVHGTRTTRTAVVEVDDALHVVHEKTIQSLFTRQEVQI